MINKDSVTFVHSHGMIDENDKHPSFYGGAYIKNDSIVFLLSKQVPLTKVMNIATDKCQSRLRIESCKYSYLELLNTEKILDEFFFKEWMYR